MGFSWTDDGDFAHKCDCACDATRELYRLSAVAQDGFRVGAFEDDTCVWIGDDTGPQRYLGCIDQQEILTSTIGAGEIIYTNDKRVSASGEEGSTDIELLPDYVANDTLGTIASRYGGITLTLWSLTATSADIYRNGALVTTIPLIPGQVGSYSQTGTYTGNWKVIANGQVMGYRQEDNFGNGDGTAIFKPSDEILGWHSTAAYIAGDNAPAGTSIQAWVQSNNAPFNGTIATTYNIINWPDTGSAGAGAGDNYYDPRVALRVLGQTGDIYGSSVADSDGGNTSAFIPVDLMTTHHLIPQPTEYVSIVGKSGSVVTVTQPGGATSTVTLTNTGGSAQKPFAARLGTPNGGSNLPAGLLLSSPDPIHVVYQPKGAGGFGSDDDETISFGYNL